MRFPDASHLTTALVLIAPAAFGAAPEVLFHDAKSGGEALLDDAEAPYFALLQPREMWAKCGRQLDGDLAGQREAFRAICRDSVLDFTEEETSLIREGIDRVHPYLEEHYSILAETPWSFIKVSSAIEGGLPHTRGDHIVLSEAFFGWVASMPEDRQSGGLAYLLVHELMHVVQRDHAEAFEALFADVWGFRQVGGMPNDDWIEENQIFNPDGTSRWIYPVGEGTDGHWLWTTLLLGEAESGLALLPRDVQMIGVTIDEKDDGVSVRLDSEGAPVFRPLLEVEAFKADFAFANANNLYHPNEITADALAQLVVAGLLGVDPPSDDKLDSLAGWFADNLHAPAGD